MGCEPKITKSKKNSNTILKRRKIEQKSEEYFNRNLKIQHVGIKYQNTFIILWGSLCLLCATLCNSYITESHREDTKIHKELNCNSFIQLTLQELC